MCSRYYLKPARQTLGQAGLDQKGRRAKQNDMKRPLLAGIGIPQTLYRIGPTRNLLDFVNNKYSAFFIDLEPPYLPLLFYPYPCLQRGDILASISSAGDESNDPGFTGVQICGIDLPRGGPVRWDLPPQKGV